MVISLATHRITIACHRVLGRIVTTNKDVKV